MPTKDDYRSFHFTFQPRVRFNPTVGGNGRNGLCYDAYAAYSLICVDEKPSAITLFLGELVVISLKHSEANHKTESSKKKKKLALILCVHP